MSAATAFPSTPTASGVALEQRRGSRPTTARRHSRDLLLFYRVGQMGCSNEYGWGSQPEQQPQRELEPLCEQALECEHDAAPLPLFVGPPPGLEMDCASSQLELTSTKDDTPIPVMTLDAMLPSTGRESALCEAFGTRQDNAFDKQTKSSLFICLSECIDDASTVASDGGDSPAVVAQELPDSASARSSPAGCASAIAASAVASSPTTPVVCSLEKALGFAAPMVSPMAARPCTPISLEAMLGLSSLANQPDSATDQGQGAWTPTSTPTAPPPAMPALPALPAALNMPPMGGVNSMVCPWWWPNVEGVPSSSHNNTDNAVNLTRSGSGSVSGLGSWAPTMHATMPGTTTAFSGANGPSEIFQI